MADDLPRAFLAHRLPGRLRVRVPSRKGDRTYFGRAAERLGAHPGIRAVRVSPRTASVAIEHDGPAGEVARLARECGLFDLPEGAVVATLAEAAPARIVGVQPRAAVAAGLAGLGVVQLARGNVAGTGLEHLWQSYGAARGAGGFKLAAAMALLAAVQAGRGSPQRGSRKAAATDSPMPVRMPVR